MPFSIVLTAENADEDHLIEVKEVLESIPGSYLTYNATKKREFPFIPAPPQEGAMIEPEFFDWMQQFREGLKNKIAPNDILVVLTSRKVANGHFNGIDFKHRHIFVDLNNWQQSYLPDSPPKYPIAYHVFVSTLLVIYFKDTDTARAALHWEDKGCILDYNSEKPKVELKILTARICPVCLDTLLTINPDTNLLSYFRSGLEKIRHDLVEGEYYNNLKPKPMRLIFGNDRHFHFEGVGSMKLDNAHSLVYLYFLKNKGVQVFYNELKNDLYDLNQLFRKLKKNKSKKGEEKLNKVVVKLCGLKYVGTELEARKNNAMSERISLINKEITKAVGTFGLQAHYQIQRQLDKHGVSKDIDFRDESGLLYPLEP